MQLAARRRVGVAADDGAGLRQHSRKVTAELFQLLPRHGAGIAGRAGTGSRCAGNAAGIAGVEFESQVSGGLRGVRADVVSKRGGSLQGFGLQARLLSSAHGVGLHRQRADQADGEQQHGNQHFHHGEPSKWTMHGTALPC